MQVKKQQLELDMEQQTGSKEEKEYVKAVYCHAAYLTYMQRNTGLEEAQAGMEIAGRNLNNLRYADDTTLMAESEKWKWKWSHVWLFVTPWTVAYQAPLSMGFSKQ